MASSVLAYATVIMTHASRSIEQTALRRGIVSESYMSTWRYACGRNAAQVFGRLVDLLNRLDDAHIYYALLHTRDDSVMVDVSLPGSHWEIEFLTDGSIEVERFRSVAGVEGDPEILEELFANIHGQEPWSDCEVGDSTVTSEDLGGAGPVEAAVRRSVSPGDHLATPTGRGRFTVAQYTAAELVLLLGTKQARTPLPWRAIEGIPDLLRGRGWVPIGGVYSTGSQPGSLDEFLKAFLKRATAGWVAVVLEQAGVVTISRSRPACVQLRPGW
jgi:hypothetical protein